MKNEPKIKVLAFIHPIERYVGHWACSSEKIEARRILMQGENLENKVIQALEHFQPDYLAMISKKAAEYLDYLDELSYRKPEIKPIPRIFRSQNTMLYSRFGEQARDFDLCWRESTWFRLACDPRWEWVLVQTLDDVEIIKAHLPEKTVSGCPYGYDPRLIDPDLPEMDRDIDVGCYMNLNGHPDRIKLVETAEKICRKHRLNFQFTDKIYWHPYVQLIQRTRMMLNWSNHSEVPFRMYEATALGAVFLTNPLKCGVETLFSYPTEYLIYKQDFSDLEENITGLMRKADAIKEISLAGKQRARHYSWPKIADEYIAPALAPMIQRQ